MKKKFIYFFFIAIFFTCKKKNELYLHKVMVGYKNEPIKPLQEGDKLLTNEYNYVFVVFRTEEEISLEKFEYDIKTSNKDTRISEDKKYLNAKSNMQQYSNQVVVSFKCKAKSTPREITILGKLKKQNKEAKRTIKVLSTTLPRV